MTLSPGSGGPLIDPDGRIWTVTRRRLDLRVVRRALRNSDHLVLLGESGGFDLRWIGPTERGDLWERVRHSYAGQGGSHKGDYTGYQFADEQGRRLLYVEMWC